MKEKWKHSVQSHPSVMMAVLLLALGLYHAAMAFLGLDLIDEGFYMTFYEHIFTHPAAVEYNFMYYLTGLVGGVWFKAFDGLLAMRLLGIAVIVVAAWLTWRLMRGKLPWHCIAVGLTLVLLGYIRRPYAWGNAMGTALFYVAAYCALWRGLARRSSWWIAVAGSCCGLNVFMRIPNLLTFALVAAVPVAELMRPRDERRWRSVLPLCLAFVAGWLVAIGAIWMLMVALGHDAIFAHNMSDLLGVFTNDHDAAQSHRSGSLFRAQGLFYASLARNALIYGALWVAYRLINKHFNGHVRAVTMAVLCLAAAAMLLAASPFVTLCLVGIAGCLWMLIKGDYPARVLAAMGLFMMLVMPMGSDTAYNHGTLPLLMAVPVACVPVLRHRGMRGLTVVLVCAIMARMAVGGSFSDHGAVWQKTATVTASSRLHGIHTAAYRAQALDELLTGIDDHIHAGDTLLVLIAAPMINYLTGTVPHGGNSWPWLHGPAALQRQLDTAPPPAVLLAKCSNPDGRWERLDMDFLATTGYQHGFDRNQRFAAIHHFLLQHNYRCVWTSRYFSLYTPSD